MTSNRPYLLRAVYQWICDNGLTPYIVVDAARPGVQVPPQAVSEGRVVLNLAPRAVASLEMGNETITFMARFGGASCAVNVPVAAVQAIYARENGQGMLLAEEAQGSAMPATDSPTASSTRTSAPSLQAVPATGFQDPTAEPAGDVDASADGGDPDKPRPKGKPTLRVIK